MHGEAICIPVLMYRLVFVNSIEYNSTAIILFNLDLNKLPMEERC